MHINKVIHDDKKIEKKIINSLENRLVSNHCNDPLGLTLCEEKILVRSLRSPRGVCCLRGGVHLSRYISIIPPEKNYTTGVKAVGQPL